MAYVAVEKNGLEVMLSRKPYREKQIFEKRVEDQKLTGKWSDADYISGHVQYRNNTRIVMPRGTIEKLIGRKLYWADEPVKLV